MYDTTSQPPNSRDCLRSVYQPRQIWAYGTLSILIAFVLFYGVADSIPRMYPASGMKGFSEAVPEPASLCMFSTAATPCLNTYNGSSRPGLQTLQAVENIDVR